MNGQIIDVEQSFHAGFTSGVISGEDGITYKFSASDWRDTTAPKAGLAVNFLADGGRARSVSRVDRRFSPINVMPQQMNGIICSANLFSKVYSQEFTIIAEDGHYYPFNEQEWVSHTAPKVGLTVVFTVRAGNAYQVKYVELPSETKTMLSEIKDLRDVQSGSGCLLPASAIASGLALTVVLTILFVS